MNTLRCDLRDKKERREGQDRQEWLHWLATALVAVCGLGCALSSAAAWAEPPQTQAAAPAKPVWSEQEKPIVDGLRGLRKLPDDVRVGTTKTLALQIRALPAVPHKLQLALGLANLSTEGDFGRDTLQEVTTTLEYKANDWALLRLEYRRDQSDYPFFDKHNGLRR